MSHVRWFKRIGLDLSSRMRLNEVLEQAQILETTQNLMKELRTLSGRGSPDVFSWEELETVTEETDVWMFLLELLLDTPTGNNS